MHPNMTGDVPKGHSRLRIVHGHSVFPLYLTVDGAYSAYNLQTFADLCLI